MAEASTPEGWEPQKLPVGMSRSYAFDSYQETRQFLDDLAELSERMDYYPNLNFTRTQVTVRIQTESTELGQVEYDFATGADAILAQKEA